MPGLVPGIHVFFALRGGQDVDGRDKPGHDEHLCGQQGLTLAIPVAISTPPGTSGLLAFGWMGENDGNDTIKRWSR